MRRIVCICVSVVFASLALADLALAEDTLLKGRSKLSLTEVRRPEAPPIEVVHPARAEPSSAALATVGTGQVQKVRKSPWRFAAAAYMWASSIDGTSYTDGNETDIDAAFSDIFDDVEYAGFGYVEIGYGRWSFAIDASTIKLSQEDVGPNLNEFEAEITQTIVDLRLGYTVFQRHLGTERWGCCCYDRCLSVDVVVGARYWDVEQELTITPGTAAPLTAEESLSWWDPYVGARVNWPFAPRWSASFYFDYGGFGLGDGADSTWKAQALLRFNITRNFFVAAGYRALYVDRVEDNPQNGIDLTYSGPMIGIGVQF